MIKAVLFTWLPHSSGCSINWPTTTRVQDWPALSGLNTSSGTLHYGRAVRGKVHRAPTDYRWIAASAELDPQSAGLLEAASIGSEDEPAGVFCWRPAANGFVAIRAYPSRARDAAGRPGG